MSFLVVIPARYASVRLAGKALLPIAGRPMIQHVFERGCESGAERVLIATDDARIEAAARDFGAEVLVTSPDHRSGTDRITEVVSRLNCADEDIIVNLQGDEPLMPPELIRTVAQDLHVHTAAAVATLSTPIHSAEELFDPNVVKVVVDKDGYALYFSRAPIPWDREVFASSKQALSRDYQHQRHIGLYAYRAEFLRAYSEFGHCELEGAEGLEQLRVLWQGFRIHVGVAGAVPPAGVDSEDDRAQVERQLLGTA